MITSNPKAIHLKWTKRQAPDQKSKGGSWELPEWDQDTEEQVEPGTIWYSEHELS